MPIYRCNKCGLVSENTLAPVSSKTDCERCGTPSTVFNSVYYVEKLVERYVAALREIEALKRPDKEAMDSAPDPGANQPPPDQSLLSLDIHNTSILATAQQHAPLKAWFAARQIDAKFDHTLVDTSGFFDDAAKLIGERFVLFGELVDRIRYAYRNSHGNVSIEVGSLSQKDSQAINALCRQLYSHTFFSRYHYQKPEKIIRLTLQSAPAVRQFFDGGWLEWFAFIELIGQLKETKRSFSCARSVKVVFPNEDLHELDVMVLPEGQAPICIECKSGEFRRDIDKYLRLRKRLGIDRSRFIICASDLSDELASGLSAMHELSFASLNTLGQKLQNLL